MASKRKGKLPAKSKVKRQYDNTARAEKSKQTELSIVKTYVELLVEKRGGEVPLGEVAKRTGISQRTIFRFFEDKETLHAAMDNYLLSYLQASITQMSSLDFVGFAKNAFALFDKNEDLTTAYVLSPFGNKARELFRAKLSAAMITRIVNEKKIDLNDKTRKRLALVTALVNAKIWYDLKNENGYSGQDMAEALDWALTSLLEKVSE